VWESVISGVIVLAIAAGWVWILLPGVVRRLRRDPLPVLPPVPLNTALGLDGEANVYVVREALATVCGRVTVVADREPYEVLLRGPGVVGSAGVAWSWDETDTPRQQGRFYLHLEGLGDGGDSFWEFDRNSDIREAFWVAVGVLRGRIVSRGPRTWVHVQESGIWRAFREGSTGWLEPIWVTDIA